MANYDESTQRFMEDVSGKPHPGPKPDLKKDLTVIGKGVTRAVLNKQPKSLVGAAIRVADDIAHPSKIDEIEKNAAIRPNMIIRLYAALNTHFDREWHDWEPETLWKELPEIGFQVTDELKNAVMALQVIVNTNAPFEQWHIYENVGHAFAGNDVNFSIVQPLELTEIAALNQVLKRIRPHESFLPEICGYIAACAKTAGVVYLAPDLFGEGCQSFLDEMNNDLELKERVMKVWPASTHPEEATAIQLARLSEVREYLADNG